MFRSEHRFGLIWYPFVVCFGPLLNRTGGTGELMTLKTKQSKNVENMVSKVGY